MLFHKHVNDFFKNVHKSVEIKVLNKIMYYN